ncbi:substrate-binding domain-containing protein [Agrococcus sp. SGAir0287]|uniref:substrate-binding domain-containing protein n=1 Tax=Agrococcus sp. SGAir0287 TaxID=2070347 RepID=UPI0010CCC8AB|nr:substrate-binding domain-containing protein [Agrococcus sp. SGAir0287]QCR18193.1 sugar ABC transporter substrate-binding protein [Agrococcus sp. SGAir0287]
MRRTILGTAAATAAMLLLAGCSGAIDTGTGTPDASSGDIPRPAACDADSPFIAVSLPNLTNPYYVAMQTGFQEAGEEAGFEVQVQIANDDDAQQLAQVEAMLQQEPCALALNAVKSGPGAAIVAAANAAGVPVFTVNVGIDPDALEAQGASIVQYLGADNYAGGEQMAEQVLADMGEDAELNIGFVTEPDETPTVTRDQGFEDTISANPNATIVASVDGNVKPDDSLEATTEMLSGNPDINVIFASTGPATYGALQALAGRTDVALYGFCASEEPIVAPYAGCVAQEPESYGAQVIEQIGAWIDGAEPEAEILLPLKVFTAGETPAPGEVG